MESQKNLIWNSPKVSWNVFLFLLQETDYNLNYFDNGEHFGMGDEDDDMDDGPIY